MTTSSYPPGSIVVGADGSDDAHHAIVWAAEQATLEKRPLVLLNATRTAWPSLYPGAEYLATDPESVEAFAAAARRVLATAVEAARGVNPEVAVFSITIDADPRVALVDAAAHAHLLVVGSRGRGHLSSLLLGSVSATVAARATCPVVVVHPDSGAVHASGVVVGVRFAAGSRPVVEHAFAQASLRRVPLTVLHCYLDTEGPVSFVGQPGDGDAERREQLAESVAGLGEKYPDVDVTMDLTADRFRSVLARRSAAPDLLVIGRRAGTRLEHAIGAWSTLSIVENSAGAVAVVPESA